MTTSSLVILVCCLLALDLATGQDLVQEIKSISYPKAYPNVKGGDAYGLSVKKKQISFVFEQLDLKEKDSITIFRGPAVDGYCKGDKLIEYKGTKIGSTLAGFSSVDKDGKACVDVEYDHPTENDNTTINRFKLMTYSYEICGQGNVYKLSSMYLASHMYPSVYPSGQACNWKARPEGSHSSQRIVVKLERVNVAKNHYLELGPINNKQVRYTSATSQVVTTDSNNLDIKFNTKDKQTPSGTGFLFSYTLIGCKSTEVPKKTNAAPQNIAKFHDANYKVQYKCNSGYEFKSEAAFEYAVCNGNTWKWENTAPNTECVRIECPSLGTLENGQISLTDKYFYKSVATFTCDAGATLHGVSKLTCNVDGEWSGSGTLPLCLTAEQTTCAPLIAPAHGHWTCQSIGMNDSNCLSHGSVQTLTCNTGFSVNSTNVLNRCNFTEWQNSNLHCERNCCPDVTSEVAAVAHLDFTADSFCYTHRVTYSCAVGYVLEGEAERECGPDGDWQPNATIPSCRAVDCGPPPSVDEQTRVSYDKTGYQDRAIYSCKDGDRYMLVGPTTVSCGKDEKWSEVTGPSCVLRECYLYELQLSAPGAIVTPEKKQYYVGDVAAHICGNVTSVITCTARGWLGAVKSAKPCRSSVSRLGVYQSPDYPVPYNRPPQTLLRQFSARPEERIVFVINDLSINNDDVLSFAPGQVKGSICGEDIVKSYVGGDRSNIPISDVVMTPSERACSEFSIVREPSIDIVRTGFNIDVFGLHKCPEDRDAYTITEPAFYIASPNYPNLFETGYDCFWYIAPESCSAGQRVKVLVEYLSTAASSSEHCAHQLVIGPVKSSQKILCGEKEDEAIEVDGCVASVHFDARATTEHADQGFFLSYSVTGCSAESLPLKDKATLVNAAAYYPVGYTAVFRCDRGYWFRSGTQEEYAYCDASNSWSSYTSGCIERPSDDAASDFV